MPWDYGFVGGVEVTSSFLKWSGFQFDSKYQITIGNKLTAQCVSGKQRSFGGVSYSLF